MASGIVNFESGSSVRSEELVAHSKIGIGTHTQTANVHCVADAPVVVVEDKVGNSTQSALRILTDGGTTHLQSGVDLSSDSKGDFKFQSMLGATTHMTIDGTNSRIGIGTASPGAQLHVQGETYDPSLPTVHIGDDVYDGGDYGMVNLVRHGDSGGSKSHLAFIRMGHSVFGMGFHNNTNNFGFWPSFSGVTNTPAMSWNPAGNVGINCTSHASHKLDVNGDAHVNGMLYAEGTRLKYQKEYRYQDTWTSNNNQTFTIPVTGQTARGLLQVEAKVIQVAANSSGERVARVKGVLSNYHTGNFYMTVLEGENVFAFETYIVGTSGSATGTFTMKYRPQEGYQQSVGCRLYLKIFIGGVTESLGALTRTDAGSNSALTEPGFNPNNTTHAGSIKVIRGDGRYPALRADDQNLTGPYGSARATGDQYNFIMSGPRPGQNENGFTVFINSANRTTDGGASCCTVRNDNGPIRLGNAAYRTFVEKICPASLDTTVGSLTYNLSNAVTGHYLYQDIMTAPIANTLQTWQRQIQIVRAGSLVSISGYIVFRTSSSTPYVYLNWAQMGFETAHNMNTVWNGSTFTAGTLSGAPYAGHDANYVYIYFPGPTQSPNIVYTNLYFVLDMAHVSAYG